MGFIQRRIIRSGRFSVNGLLATFREEEAFKVEIFLAVFLVPLGMYLGETAVEKVLLTGSVFMVLIVEILNSAIETIVDRFGGERHTLSGQAKDQGSAAVFLSLLLLIFVWVICLLS